MLLSLLLIAYGCLDIMVTDAPDVPTLAYLEVVVMPNRELISVGKSLGFLRSFGKHVHLPEELKEKLNKKK